MNGRRARNIRRLSEAVVENDPYAKTVDRYDVVGGTVRLNAGPRRLARRMRRHYTRRGEYPFR